MGKIRCDRENLYYAIYILLCVYKYSFYGFYYPGYLDDYVQYIYYPSIENPFKNLLFGGAGTAYTRPLAALLDVYFWSTFSSYFSFAVVILNVLYAVSGIFFYKAFKAAGIKLSAVFFVCYGLLPSLCEGTFWISAATRIVPAMLFAALSLFFMVRKHFFWFFISNLFSLCFYEQIGALSFFLTFVVFVSAPKKFIPYFFASLINAVLIFLYYVCFGKNGDNADRLVFSADIFKNFGNNFISLSELVILRQIPLYTRGFLRGIKMIFEQKAYLWLLFAALLCVMLAAYSPENESFNKAGMKWLFIGALAFVVPLFPFFVLENPWLNFRNLVPSVLGLSVIVGSVSAFSPRYIKVFVFTAALYMMICNVSEVNDYTKTMVYDRNIIFDIAENPVRDSENENVYYYPETVGDENYLKQNSPYNDHIMSITGSDWGLTGTVRAVTGNGEITVVRK